ncbi:MAG: hypothetical protein QGF20_00525 [Alphaproteobacteria bacterium]|nr:hypothetical protein [Alphaproteobacteria bacterium]
MQKRALAMASGRLIHLRKYISRQNALIATVINARRGNTKDDMRNTHWARGQGFDARRLHKVVRHTALEYVTLGEGAARFWPSKKHAEIPTKKELSVVFGVRLTNAS